MKLKNLIIGACAVAAVAVVADMAVGKVFDRLTSTAKGGETGKHNYINRVSTDSVMVFGSSRAAHHYNTPLMADSLGTTAYNCGIDGNGIVLAYMMLNNIIQRGHRPALVVYDLYWEFDYTSNTKGADNLSYLAHMRPFYALPGIKDVFAEVAPSETLKMRSNAYRYNYRFIQIVSDNLAPKRGNVMGYVPLSGEIKTEFVNNKTMGAVDSLKLKYLHKFVDLCRSNRVPLMLVMSPYYHRADTTKIIEPVRDLTHTPGVVFINQYNVPEYQGVDSLFDDPNHLNDRGATKFTRSLLPVMQATMRRGAE